MKIIKNAVTKKRMCVSTNLVKKTFKSTSLCNISNSHNCMKSIKGSNLTFWTNCAFPLSRILVVAYSSLQKEIYFHGTSDVKFISRLFKRKTWLVERHFWTRIPHVIHLRFLIYWIKKKNGEIIQKKHQWLIFPQIFREMLGGLVRLLGITEV